MVSLSDLYIDSNFASFEQLAQRYHIPKSLSDIYSFGILHFQT